jgi:hypothetical protein
MSILATKFREQFLDKFFVTLLSTPTDKNKDNVSTNFTNTLYKPLLLKGDYDVALSTISFSKVGQLANWVKLQLIVIIMKAIMSKK